MRTELQRRLRFADCRPQGTVVAALEGVGGGGVRGTLLRKNVRVQARA
jgi:hypothetical protein